MVSEKLDEIIETLNAAKVDAEKFDRGNSTAGARVRKNAQIAIVALKELRKLVSQIKTERRG